MKAYMQKFAQSLMLPISILPVAGLLLGIASFIDPGAISGEGNSVANFLANGGLAILDNLPILFAVGLAFGMSKDKNGAAALSGLVSFLVVTNVLSTESMAKTLHMPEEKVNLAFGDISNVFVGIICGLVTAAIYNRFKDTKLPTAFAFFSGKRLVPILSATAMLVISLALMFMWPPVYNALVMFGEFISKLGPTGAGLYGFFNRLLLPFGLHHALNQVFWFDIAGINDIANFWSSKGEQGITGRYQAGLFPIMMFGLPAAALAIWKNAEKRNKKVVGSLMLAAGLASFITGITEPLEFSFLVVAPMLFVLHAVLTGISLFIAAMFHWTAGFTFSAGLIDYLLSLSIPIANKPIMLLVLGLVMGVIYFLVFDFAIRIFNLKTPGRDGLMEEAVKQDPSLAENGEGSLGKDGDLNVSNKTKLIYEAIGGKDNIEAIDHCATRLRLTLNDTGIVDQEKIKKSGALGNKIISDKNIQIIIGTDVQFTADELMQMEQEDR
ncbi:N-acetylglucosamine-specific PTS transporter subunit IIBC [Mammaliicoccus lentus]|uniref:N-acetylglucosamine-specific PTS transporter subunit IIBC n=1 Tax=Mammaliicoccus lentus TaxID=42858 RepID=UPI001C4EF7C1|nr:N-acetylglucosamine-specific PTS transporter subunit IIBC [Mammaliicoccus lentus]MBW0768477.1 PTS transporter subunit EIIC [Mammaliicoccus lentus]WHI54545.1 N-acetylglucosamine-specific PTS transporter subunit IIBC [Mammaliicoccus lentus]WHI57067.1 N-acetylglucosamine-specific PTS transporter subunit IIBC [Mammaliicoccus lentus]WHI64912.1 N-acetylglucosamine-specific PTS transporter subunit IIBC [Mammaliicoccus lentus]WHI85804.1 N-acetylglucosamine-specific PTS transporter subunit IIBC [Mam